MATFNERIQVVIDVVAEKATKGFGDFRKAVSDAEGFTGKLKAGVGALGGQFGKLAGPAALGAVGGLALKAVDSFSKLSKTTLDLSKATGLSIEQASRWVAVADDFGLTADDVQASVSKIAKTLDASKWDRYGIQTRDASGAAKSVNDILLQTLDVLGKTSNETERARIGNELLGKGFNTLAPLVGQTRAEYEQMLSAVDAGQVITSGEAARGEKWRLAQDKLSDAIGNVALAFGNLVTAASPLLSLLGSVTQKVADLVDIAGEGDISKPLTELQLSADDASVSAGQLVTKFDKFVFKVGNARSGLDKTGAVIKTLFTIGDASKVALLDNYKKAIGELASSAPEQAGRVVMAFTELRAAAEQAGNKEILDALNARGLDDSGLKTITEAAANAAGGFANLKISSADAALSMDDVKRVLGDVDKKSFNAATSLDNARDSLKKFQDQIKGRNDLVHLVSNLDDIANKLAEITMLHAAGQISDRDYWLQSALVTGEAQQTVSDYIDTLNQLPPTVQKKLLLEYDPNAPEKFLTDLQKELDRRSVVVGVVPGFVTGPQDGPNTSPRLPGAGRSNSTPVGNVTINVAVPPGANQYEIGKTTHDALQAYYRNGGPR